MKKIDWEDLRYELSSFGRSLTLPFYKLKKKITNFFYWGWKMQDDYNWDHTSIYSMLEIKLKRLRKGCYQDGHHVWSEKSREYKAISECIRLCGDMQKDYDYNMSQRYHLIDYEIKEDSIDGFFKIIDRRSPQEKKLDKYAREKDNEVQKARKARLFELMNKWDQFWWD